jgi:hypothetical protein
MSLCINFNNQLQGECSMKYVHVVFGCIALFSTTAFGLDISLENRDAKHRVRIEDGSAEIERPAGEVDMGRQPAKSASLRFNKLRLNVDADLHIHLGDRVDVDVGRNKGAISVQTNRGMLTLSSGPESASSDSDDESDGDSNVEVWAQKLDTVVLDSAGDIELENVRQRNLEIILNGSGTIHMTGQVENLIATINGSGDLDLEDLVSENATVKINGSGTANVHVRRVLNAEITGAGDINYRGMPGRVIPKITGAGSVEQM